MPGSHPSLCRDLLLARRGCPARPLILTLLRFETHARREDGVHQARREALVEDHRLRGATGDEVAGRMLGGVEDDVRDDARFVDRWQTHRLDSQLGARFVEEGCVYLCAEEQRLRRRPAP